MLPDAVSEKRYWTAEEIPGENNQPIGLSTHLYLGLWGRGETATKKRYSSDQKAVVYMCNTIYTWMGRDAAREATY